MNTQFSIFSIAALAAALIALVVSVITCVRLKRSDRDRRDMRTLQIVREMQRRSREVLESFREHPDDVHLQETYEDSTRDLADIYENLCRQYHEGDMDREWFFGMYGRDLICWVESGPLREEFSCRRPRHEHTGRAYRELRRTYCRARS